MRRWRIVLVGVAVLALATTGAFGLGAAPAAANPGPCTGDFVGNITYNPNDPFTAPVAYLVDDANDVAIYALCVGVLCPLWMVNNLAYNPHNPVPTVEPGPRIDTTGTNAYVTDHANDILPAGECFL